MAVRDVCLGVSGAESPLTYQIQCYDEECEKLVDSVKKMFPKWERTTCSDGTWKIRFFYKELQIVLTRWATYDVFALSFQQECCEITQDDDSLKTQDFL
ncbi:hypothetical protein IKS86_04530 [bacterium]|nr:hypothetical protein [bacterium]